jgi:hypothetical protein
MSEAWDSDTDLKAIIDRLEAATVQVADAQLVLQQAQLELSKVNRDLIAFHKDRDYRSEWEAWEEVPASPSSSQPTKRPSTTQCSPTPQQIAQEVEAHKKHYISLNPPDRLSFLEGYHHCSWTEVNHRFQCIDAAPWVKSRKTKAQALALWKSLKGEDSEPIDCEVFFPDYNGVKVD